MLELGWPSLVTSQTYAFINQQTLSKYYIEKLGEPKLLRFLKKKTTVTSGHTSEKLDVLQTAKQIKLAKTTIMDRMVQYGAIFLKIAKP